MEEVFRHHELQGLRRVLLATRGAHALYAAAARVRRPLAAG